MNMKTQQEIEELAEIYANSIQRKQPLNNIQKGAFIAGYTACQEEDRWVPVSERLPEDVSTVIISDSSTGVVTTGWHILPEGWFTDAIVCVTHWKKLPNPPKK